MGRPTGGKWFLSAIFQMGFEAMFRSAVEKLVDKSTDRWRPRASVSPPLPMTENRPHRPQHGPRQRPQRRIPTLLVRQHCVLGRRLRRPPALL